MTSFRAKGKNLMIKSYEASKDGRIKAAEKYNKKYQDLIQDVGEFLAKHKQPYDMGAFHRAVMDAVDQSAYGDLRPEDLNKNARGEFESINRATGKERFKEND